jgi:hypothetical protein
LRISFWHGFHERTSKVVFSFQDSANVVTPPYTFEDF